jgi:hypothetical protein
MVSDLIFEFCFYRTQCQPNPDRTTGVILALAGCTRMYDGGIYPTWGLNARAPSPERKTAGQTARRYPDFN